MNHQESSYNASSILDTAVYFETGSKFGRLDELLVSLQTGKIEHLLVRSKRGKVVRIPWAAIHFDTDENRINLTADAERFIHLN